MDDYCGNEDVERAEPSIMIRKVDFVAFLILNERIKNDAKCANAPTNPRCEVGKKANVKHR